jgi:hypothetical protein
MGGQKEKDLAYQLFKMINFMVEVEPMMVTVLTPQCLQLKQFKSKEYHFQVLFI